MEKSKKSSKDIKFCAKCGVRHRLSDLQICWWCYQSFLSKLSLRSGKEILEDGQSTSVKVGGTNR